MILLDTNVLVAALVQGHPHNAQSIRIIDTASVSTTLIVAHSLAETYSTLTRANRPFRDVGPAVWVAIDELVAATRLVAFSASETQDAIRRFSALGTGPRLYDYLIGATGQAHGARTIVTWNVKDFVPLFPDLEIVTPDAFQALRQF